MYAIRNFFLSLLMAFLTAGSADAAEVEDQAAIRASCSASGSQADMHACLQERARRSAEELRRVERQARQALEKWDEDLKYLTLARMRFNASAAEFQRYRKTHCGFMASLAGGAAGNSSELMRLACLIELDDRRAAQLESASAALPVK